MNRIAHLIRTCLIITIAAPTIALLTTIHPAEAAPSPAVERTEYRIPRAAAPCRFDDGASKRRVCVWDGRHSGNGYSRSFVSFNGGEVITYVTHRRAHRMLKRWRKAHRVVCAETSNSGGLVSLSCKGRGFGYELHRVPEPKPAPLPENPTTGGCTWGVCPEWPESDG